MKSKELWLEEKEREYKENLPSKDEVNLLLKRVYGAMLWCQERGIIYKYQDQVDGIWVKLRDRKYKFPTYKQWYILTTYLNWVSNLNVD